MSMSSFALTVLGLEAPHRLTRTIDMQESHTTSGAAAAVPAARIQAKPSKRTQYANAVQTICSPSMDEPPSYARATQHRLQPSRRSTEGAERLPGYSCSIAAEAKLLLNVESIDPLDQPSSSEWREVYVVLRGTMLSFHRVKDDGAGKLIRNYTLQHAECGLATDSEHTVLVPQTRLARLIPAAARRRAWSKDHELFMGVKLTLFRLRLETDQLLLADSSEDNVYALILAICAAIDISHPIDERSMLKQCTMPRRRRRPRAEPTGDLTDPALLREQAQILQQQFPALAAPASPQNSSAQTRPALARRDTDDTQPPTPAREEDELDLSLLRTSSSSSGSGSGPPTPPSPSTDDEATLHNPSMLHASPCTNFSPLSGKWSPPPPSSHNSPAHQQRYTRRCLPILLATTPRASDVLVAHGRRVKINWRTEVREAWSLRPPGYKAHGFAPAAEEEDSEGMISPAPSPGVEVEIEKTFAAAARGKAAVWPALRRKGPAAAAVDMGVPAIVFCL